ncbi:MAG: hypothetical protein AAGE85_13050 [Pseudomonadota bacterium]
MPELLLFGSPVNADHPPADLLFCRRSRHRKLEPVVNTDFVKPMSLKPKGGLYEFA